MAILRHIGHIFGYLIRVYEMKLEWYMKYVVMELNDSNEPMTFHNSILGNYNFDTYL